MVNCSAGIIIDPKYDRLWADYAKKYNELSDKLIAAGIDVKHQINLLNAFQMVLLYHA
jgi:hypothetical protein